MGLKRAIAGFFSRNLAYLRQRPLRLLIVGGAALVGAVAGVPAGDAGFTYTWADARFCDDCHVHDYANEAWARSPHADLTTCHDCHMVPLRHYPKNLWLAAFDRPQTPEDIPHPDVATVICERCHASAGAAAELTGPMPDAMRAKVVKIDQSPLHRVHLDSEDRDPGSYRGATLEPEHAVGAAADGRHGPGAASAKDAHGGHGGDEHAITCMDCHGAENNRAHRFEATTKNCVACHGGQHIEEGRLASIACRECHFDQFLASTTLSSDVSPK